jgi:D-alanine-D-alanine ligase
LAPLSAKLRVGIVFGGRSAEHEVSLVSAASVIEALDKEKYEIILIGITPEGRWVSSDNILRLLKEKTSGRRLTEFIITPDPTKRALVSINGTWWGAKRKPVDVLFPLVHGTYGEDGTLQGLFELADIPYVGAGVLGSAVGMDKVVQKQLLEHAGIPVAPGYGFLSSEFQKSPGKLVQAIEHRFRYPIFVKPANLGSSVGITKAHMRAELLEGIQLAGEYDRKILVEKGIENAREIECSVLGNDEPRASVPGEIIPSNEFYDYDAKYVDGKSTAIIPATMRQSMRKAIQRYAVQAFRVLGCEGMARVDFLLQRATNRIYLNEINTIPGFTPISMYPKLWAASGLPYPQLLDRLIELAIERHTAKRKLKTAYHPKRDWYRHHDEAPDRHQ